MPDIHLWMLFVLLPGFTLIIGAHMNAEGQAAVVTPASAFPFFFPLQMCRAIPMP